MVPSGFSIVFEPCATTMSASSGGSAFGTEMPTAFVCAFGTGVHDGEDACTAATAASEATVASAAPPATRRLVICIRAPPAGAIDQTVGRGRARWEAIRRRAG